MIKIFAVSGYKNSGKTTLCLRLLAELKRLGVRVGYIKRTSEEIFTEDESDSSSVEKLGVRGALWGPDGLRFEEREAAALSPHNIAARYFPEAEIVIVEGGKYLDLPRIWVEGEEKRPDNVGGVFMIYDRSARGDGALTFGAGDEEEMARRLAATVRGKFYRSSKVYIGDKALPMKDFIADFVRGAVLGMLASLKGGKEPDGPIRIFIDENDEKEAK
ncbi:MAG: molybdopterin-guanine dinucleotide biosynthesis protein MobB [Synergistaceae bacterium]|nr:molybdopterin-guanine dinucleotide biosynthesis protein MobB [Synergistaceae bacterium]